MRPNSPCTYALWWSRLSEHVGEQGCVALLLLSHKLDQRAVLRSEASSQEVLLREGCKAVVEEIQLDPLLVQAESDRLVVEVTVDHVSRESAVGSKPASRGVRNWLWVLQGAIGVVVSGSGRRSQVRDGRSQWRV